MKKKINSPYYVFIAISLLMFSCKGDDGPPGPRGPQGPQGPAGQGGAGLATAVQYEVLPSDWGDDGTFGEVNYLYGVQLPNADITQNVYDYGMVLTYFRLDGSSVWEALPAAFAQETFDQFINVRHNVGNVFVEIFENDFQTQAPDVTMYFKVVVIDGVASNNKHSLPPIDFTNYEAVKAYYNLKD